MNPPKFIHLVKEALLKRQDLTHQTEILAGHGWRLAAKIHYLRKKGWPIITDLDIYKIAHYRLPTGWYPEQTTGKGG